jgi:bacteriorhodopsin
MHLASEIESHCRLLHLMINDNIMLVILFYSAAHIRSLAKSLFFTVVCALLAVLLALMWTRHVNVLLLRKEITYKVIPLSYIIILNLGKHMEDGFYFFSWP